MHFLGVLVSEGHPYVRTVAGLLGVLSITGRLLLTGTLDGCG